MDSINKQQPEENHENLQGKAALQKIRELTEKNKTCFFCTQPIRFADDSPRYYRKLHI